jgi:hypothetical protein
MKTVESSREFVNWDETHEIVGQFVGVRKYEQKPEDRETDILGYEFDLPDGSEVLISDNWQIRKALSHPDVGTGSFLKITHLGVTKTANGNQLRKFKVDLFDDENEYLAYVKNMQPKTESKKAKQ